MKEYIDLTLPIVPHWRCMHEDEVIELCSTAKGDPASVTRFPLQTHWYTHIDAPVHQFAGGEKLNDFSIVVLIWKGNHSGYQLCEGQSGNHGTDAERCVG